MPMTSALYAGLTGLFLMALSIRVSLMRIDSGVLRGEGSDPRMARAIRAQVNLAEYGAMAMLLLVLLELQGAPGWALHALGLLFLGGRLLHWWTFIDPAEPVGLRKAAMVATYSMLLLAGMANIALSLGLPAALSGGL